MRDLSAADLDWNGDSATSLDTASLIDRHSAFDGIFRSQRDLRVEGELKGNVTCDGTLFVSEGRDGRRPRSKRNTSPWPASSQRRDSLPGTAPDLAQRESARQTSRPGRWSSRKAPSTRASSKWPASSGPRRDRSAPGRRDRPVSVDTGVSRASAGRNGTTFIRRLGSPEAPWESPEEDGTSEPEAT